MLIDTIEQAEKVVENNYFLEWDAWDILILKKTPSGQFRKDGIRRGNAWYVVKSRISTGREGWNVPDRYVRL